MVFSTFSKLGTWSGVRLRNRYFLRVTGAALAPPPAHEVVIKVIEQLSLLGQHQPHDRRRSPGPPAPPTPMCTAPSSRSRGQQPPSDTWWERAPLPSSSSTPPATSSVRFRASEPAQPPSQLDLALQWSANCAADRSPQGPGSPFSLHGPLTGTPHCLRGTESVNSAAALSIFPDLPCLWQASQGHLWVCFGSWFELLRGAAAQESVSPECQAAAVRTLNTPQ